MEDLTNFDRGSYEDGADHEAYILRRVTDARSCSASSLTTAYDMTFRAAYQRWSGNHDVVTAIVLGI